MLKRHIIHPELNRALATLGHGDLLFISDGGYPTPANERRIDLAIAPNLPELRPILLLLKEELFLEKVIVASEMEPYNPLLFQWISQTFAGIEIEQVPHKPALADLSKTAKYVVRTGAMDPWGNIGLVIGVNWELILDREGVQIPNEMLPPSLRT
jgi:D-ribose pyranase